MFKDSFLISALASKSMGSDFMSLEGSKLENLNLPPFSMPEDEIREMLMSGGSACMLTILVEFWPWHFLISVLIVTGIDMHLKFDKFSEKP